jgi:hypothetical protein
MLSVAIKSIMLNVIILNVIMLNVMAPNWVSPLSPVFDIIDAFVVVFERLGPLS